MNCLKICFLRQLPKYVCDSRHLNRFNANICRKLTESSNQRIITLNANQLKSDSKQTNLDKKDILDKTKANIKITFIRNDGKELIGFGKEGDSLLDVVVDNDIDLDGFGACEATLACSTCHLIFTKQDFDKIQDKPTDEELDMLDLAYGLSDTSRLGCQVILSRDFDGLVVRVPAGVNDVRTT